MEQQRGQTLVEMALVLPVFLLFVMGIFDLGRAVLLGNTVAEAARQGARYAVVNPADCTGIKTAVTNALAGVAQVAPSAVTINEASGIDTGDPVTVSVTTTFTPITPLIAQAMKASSVTIQRASTMKIENGSTGPHC